jgi:predicted nucleic acid-binding protein
LLVRLADTELVQAKWTQEIHNEWMRNLQKNRPDLSWDKIERTKDLMNAAVLDALVEGYEYLIPTLILPDPDDRHILAAAIHAKASVIVTSNLKDFPIEILEGYGIETLTSDDFACNLLELDSETVIAVIREQRSDLRHPPKTARQMLDDFARHGLQRFSERSVQYIESF